jgi:hypothetical protein
VGGSHHALCNGSGSIVTNCSLPAALSVLAGFNVPEEISQHSCSCAAQLFPHVSPACRRVTVLYILLSAHVGFNVPQEVPQHSWLRRKVPAPVNRYSLRPGRHWDGVDRSNGFEKEMFKMLNQRNAQELEARMWAQEDM